MIVSDGTERPLKVSLTLQQYGMVELLAEGRTAKQIAELAKISVDAVKMRFARIYEKTGCANRVELIRRYYAEREAPVDLGQLIGEREPISVVCFVFGGS